MSAFGGKADIRRKRSANEARADVRTCRLNNLQLLAYRLQADRFGDLDGESKHLLDRSESPEKAGEKAADLVQRIAEVRPAPSSAVNGTGACSG